jgi:uncharacterized protein
MKLFQLLTPLRIVSAVLAFSLVLACNKKKDEPEESEETVFDKQGMLVNFSDNLIIPSLMEARSGLDSLQSAYNRFLLTPDAAQLQNTRAAFHKACLLYQRVSIHGFGPGEDAGIRVNFNVFPCDTARVKTNMSTGVYDLSSAANVAAQGFPALEFLFYGHAMSDQGIVSEFTASPARRNYVSALLARMSQLMAAITGAWNGHYRQTFVNSLGTDVGSSIGFLINQLNFELDYLKNAKLATPLGLRSGGAPLPDNCEAYYSGQSVKYAVETLNAIENGYRGKSWNGINGAGFDDYISHLGSQHVNGSLAAAIDAQFITARAKLTAIPDPLSQQVISNKPLVDEAYRELVKLLVLLKTDLPSALGVVITYQDGDGD